MVIRTLHAHVITSSVNVIMLFGFECRSCFSSVFVVDDLLIIFSRASTMLLEMSMRMGSKHINNDVRELASRRANRQQQRILLQVKSKQIEKKLNNSKEMNLNVKIVCQIRKTR